MEEKEKTLVNTKRKLNLPETQIRSIDLENSKSKLLQNIVENTLKDIKIK